MENHAVKNLLKATKFDNLEDMKGHLIFVHPNLSMMSSETPLASMIAKMAMNHSDYRYFIIDNNLNLATNFENPKLASRTQGSITSLSDSDKLFSRSGLALPIDLNNRHYPDGCHGVSKSGTKQDKADTLILWIDTSEQNGISKGKAKRLFAFVSDTEKCDTEFEYNFGQSLEETH